MQETFTYDDMNRLTGITLKRPSGQDLHCAVTYDALGRMTSRQAVTAVNNVPQVTTVFSQPVFDNTKVHALSSAQTTAELFSSDAQTVTYTGFDKVSKIVAFPKNGKFTISNRVTRRTITIHNHTTMKKPIIIITLAVFMPLLAAAQYGRQPVSIIPHFSVGWGGFPGKSGTQSVDHWIGVVGAEAKIGLTDNWSLLAGLEYQFRYDETKIYGYSNSAGAPGTPYYKKFFGHYLRLPVRMNYENKKYYVAFGPYLEKGFGKMTDNHEFMLVGLDFEHGGRFKLSNQDYIRIGVLTSFGCTLQNQNHSDLIGYYELHWLLKVGYEHQL